MNNNENHKDRMAGRREERLRALGTRSPQCCVPGCRETDPFALTGAGEYIVCREHLAARQGRDRLERHHPAGRHNDSLTVPLSTNDHGVLSEYQALWPAEILRNADGSPLIRIAADLRGWLDVLRVVIDRTVGWIPAALERLDALLTTFIGPGWWDTLEWYV